MYVILYLSSYFSEILVLKGTKCIRLRFKEDPMPFFDEMGCWAIWPTNREITLNTITNKT